MKQRPQVLYQVQSRRRLSDLLAAQRKHNCLSLHIMCCLSHCAIRSAQPWSMGSLRSEDAGQGVQLGNDDSIIARVDPKPAQVHITCCLSRCTIRSAQPQTMGSLRSEDAGQGVQLGNDDSKGGSKCESVESWPRNH